MKNVAIREVSDDVCAVYVVRSMVHLDSEFASNVKRAIALNRENHTFQAAFELHTAISIGKTNLSEYDIEIGTMPIMIRAITEPIPDNRLFPVVSQENINSIFQFIISHPYSYYGFINPNDFLDLTVCAFDQLGMMYRLQNLEIYVGGDLVRSYVNYSVKDHTEPIIKKSVPYFIDNLV